MRILLVHDYGTPTGGAELQMLALRRGLRERGHDVRLFSSRAALVHDRTESDFLCFGTNSRLQVLTQTFNPSAYARLRDVLRSFQPDVVHVRMFLWQISPSILPLLRGRPCLYQTATYKCVCPTGTKLLPDGSACEERAGAACLRNHCLTPQSWAVLMIQRHLWLRSRDVFGAIVAISHVMKARLEACGVSPVEVIQNGVPERPMRPPLGEERVVAYAGRLSREKGVDVLLRAAAMIRPKAPAFRLLIAGQGPLEGELKNLANTLGLADCTEFTGHLNRGEMERAFERAWVQAIPSLWDEPFGNVATEAMMRGTAVITSRMGGLAEIIEDGVTGLHVPPGRPEALASALESLLADRARTEAMGCAGHRRAVERFSERRCLDHFEELYARLIAGARSRSVARMHEPDA